MISAFFKKNPILSWVFVALVAILAAEGGYLAYLAAKPDPTTGETEASVGAPQEAPGLERDTEAEIADSDIPEEEPAATAQLVLPRFDLLRVETDGSTVIAGSAPGARTIELISNGTVIATTNVSENGDFVFALDNPFSPGAYELSLRATAGDGTILMSKETGIINVPESGGELLAMVDSEGQAPRIMQKPQSSPAAPSSEPAETATDQRDPVTETKETETASAQLSQEPVAEPNAAERDTTEPNRAAAQTMETASAESPETSGEAEAEPATQGSPPVLVQAVDVEGDRLFIAGTGVPGRSVNIYIDDEYLGTATVGAERSFLLETQKALDNGEYEIRADMLGSDGASVDQRAAVRLLHDADIGAASAVAQAQTSEQDTGAQTPREPGTEGTTVIGRSTADSSEESASGSEASQTADAASSGSQTENVAMAPAEAEQDGGIPEIERARAEILPIVRTGDSVIIRKGDNLWRISRRMLGHGLHYTVIYNANQHQIRNPHLIYPGQIFDVPASVPPTGSG